MLQNVDISINVAYDLKYKEINYIIKGSY